MAIANTQKGCPKGCPDIYRLPKVSERDQGQAEPKENYGACVPISCHLTETNVKIAESISGQCEATLERKVCSPKTCSKLQLQFDKNKKRSCCENKICPINDPTTSTYNFLLNLRTCCKTRACQLAAKICDIYEPLIVAQPDFEDIGDQQYHYLGRDASTDSYSDVKEVPSEKKSRGMILKKVPSEKKSRGMILKEVPSEKRSREMIVKEVPSEKKNLEMIVKKVPSEKQSMEMIEPIVNVSDQKSTVITLDSIPNERIYEKSKLGSGGTFADNNNQLPYLRRRKSSTVSWSPKAINHEMSASQAELVEKAKAQAEKFRQIPGMQNSVFLEVNKPVVKDVPEVTDMDDSVIFNKSQLGGINKFDSEHKQSCCTSLRSKFKKKKKLKTDDDGYSLTDWRMSSHHSDRRKPNLDNISVKEKSHNLIV